MHLGIRESVAYARGVLHTTVGHDVLPEIVICPSFTALSEVRKVLVRTRIALGAQTMGTERFGAYTGDISVAQLDDAGCGFVVIGHSERRAMNGETDTIVRAKMKCIAQTSLVPILCVGESAAVRSSENAEAYVADQIRSAFQGVPFSSVARCIVAYEPLWAIGKTETAPVADIVAMHTVIRNTVKALYPKMTLQVVYGGSVDGANAHAILREPNIDGVLVGGASIKIHEFEAIVHAGREVMMAQKI